jgi:hypothetical protein
MSSSQNSGMGIGDFAQSLLEQSESTPVSKPSMRTLPGNVPDISNVEVIQESVDSVLVNSFGVKPTPKKEVNLEEAHQLQLKEEVLKTITKLKGLLSEMSLGATLSVGSGIFDNPNFSNGSNKCNKSLKRRRNRREEKACS